MELRGNLGWRQDSPHERAKLSEGVGKQEPEAPTYIGVGLQGGYQKQSFSARQARRKFWIFIKENLKLWVFAQHNFKMLGFY